ncbi:MAG: ABC transporter permease [Verrucomicrobiota bacterium]
METAAPAPAAQHAAPRWLAHPVWRQPVFVASLSLLAVIVLLAVFGPMVSPYAYNHITDNQFAPPSWQHWAGTDELGRDVFTRMLLGARISLLVGLTGTLVSLTIGVSLGLLAGYLRGWVDNALMRLVDFLYSIPRLIFVMVFMAVLGGGVDAWAATLAPGLSWLLEPGEVVSYARILLLFLCLGAVEWMTMARIVRGQVLVLREQPFVQASRALGQSNRRILWRHLLPNLLGVIIVYLTLTIPVIILEESFLSYLGLGVQPPLASWGSLVHDGARYLNPIKVYWWLLVFPALMMSLTLLALNFLGDSLRDAFDPRQRPRD